MPEYRTPIVGTSYRPPAQDILNTLPLGYPLFLQSEPDNTYDNNAIAIYIDDFDYSLLTNEQLKVLKGLTFGIRLPFHLGYVPAAYAAKLQREGFPKTRIDGKVTFNPSGELRLAFSF